MVPQAKKIKYCPIYFRRNRPRIGTLITLECLEINYMNFRIMMSHYDVVMASYSSERMPHE